MRYFIISILLIMVLPSYAAESNEHRVHSNCTHKENTRHHQQNARQNVWHYCQNARQNVWHHRQNARYLWQYIRRLWRNNVEVEKIVYVDKEVIVEVPVEVEKIVYVDKEVIVEVPVEVEKIVYVDREVIVEVPVEVEKIVYVDKEVIREPTMNEIINFSSLDSPTDDFDTSTTRIEIDRNENLSYLSDWDGQAVTLNDHTFVYGSDLFWEKGDCDPTLFAMNYSVKVMRNLTVLDTYVFEFDEVTHQGRMLKTHGTRIPVQPGATHVQVDWNRFHIKKNVTGRILSRTFILPASFINPVYNNG